MSNKYKTPEGLPPIASGDRYGILTVICEEAQGPRYVRRFLCRCDCGTEKIVQMAHLRSNHTTSCGCARSEIISKSRTKHGLSRKPGVYKLWCSLLQRCLNKKNRNFSHYGGRGIFVCKRWLNFENFRTDMGPRPSPEHSVNRKENNGHYNKSNCEWATQREQCRNTRKTVLSDSIVAVIRSRKYAGEGIKKIANSLSLNRATVFDCVRPNESRRTWM